MAQRMVSEFFLFWDVLVVLEGEGALYLHSPTPPPLSLLGFRIYEESAYEQEASSFLECNLHYIFSI